MKKIFSFLIILLCIPMLFGNTNIVNASTGDSSATAIPLTLGTPASGQSSTDVYYNVTVSTPGFYIFNLNTSSTYKYFDLELHNSLGNSIYSSYFDPSSNEIFYANLTTAGQYTLVVKLYGTSIPYTLFMAQTGVPSGYTQQNAKSLPLNTSVSGSFPSNMWFNFSVSTYGFYRINYTVSDQYNSWKYFYLFNSFGNQVDFLSSYKNYFEFGDYLNPGTYSFEIQGSGTSNPFTLMYANYNPLAGEFRESADYLSQNNILSGSFGNSGVVWYNTTITSSGTYKIKVDDLSLQNCIDFQVYSNNAQYENYYSYDILYSDEGILNLNPSTYSIKVMAGCSTGDLFNIQIFPYNILPGEDWNHAITIPLNTNMTATVPYAYYYNFTITNSGNYVIYMTLQQATNIHFSVTDYNYNGLGSSTSNSSTVQMFSHAFTNGTYRLNIPTYNVYSGNVSFLILPYTFHPGENLANAVMLPLNTNVTGLIPYNYWYNFTITNPGDYKIQLNNYNNQNNGNFNFDLFDSQQNYLTKNTLWDQNTESMPVTLGSGNYTIHINNNGITGQFNLEIMNYTIHSGEILSHAITLPLNTSVTGISPYNYWYNFTITNSGDYRITLSTSNSNGYALSFSLYDSNLNIISLVDSYWLQQSEISPIKLNPGNYSLNIYNYASYTTTFNLEVVSTVFQAGEVQAQPIQLTENIPFSGTVPYSMWFNFSVQTSGNYVIDVVSPSNEWISFNFIDTTNNMYYYSNSIADGYQEYSASLNAYQTYFVHVNPNTLPPIAFSIQFSPVSAQPGSKGNEIGLNLNQTVTGSFPTTEWYSFNAPVSSNYHISLDSNNTNAQLMLTIFDSNYYSIMNSFQGSTYPVESDVNLGQGFYYILVSGIQFNVNFTLKISNVQNKVSTTINPNASGNTQSTSATTTISLSPFSPLEVILLSLSSVGVVGIIRRKRR